MDNIEEWQQQLLRDGYVLVPGLFSASELEALRDGAKHAWSASGESVRKRQGAVYAARNVLALWPEACALRRHPRLQALLLSWLGPRCGLVRGLFFDKPPEQTWSLPWHKDLLIAVKHQAGLSECYSPPRLRLGVPHTEPPTAVLEGMLTARIHLDPMTPHNGPLEVQPGSQRTGKKLDWGGNFSPRTLQCEAGDVLFMRPLLAHASGPSTPGYPGHRRILHLEFAHSPDLPDQAQWWEFYPVGHETHAAAQ